MIDADPYSSVAPPAPGSATPTAPLTIVSLAAVTWEFALVGRTRMLTEAWLRNGQPTRFVQVPSLRTGLQRVLAPLRPSDPGVIRPWPAPPVRFWKKLGEPALSAAIRPAARHLRRVLSGQIDWERAVAHVISPVWLPWLESLPFRAVIYDCIDDLAVHVPRPDVGPLLRRWEDALLERCAGATVTAEVLGDDLQERRPDLPVRLIRNGVDAERFRSLARQQPRPTDVPRPGPIVGFVGALYEWIDWPLIGECVAALPDVMFVLVGPDDGNPAIEPLRARPNVRFLGPRPYRDVPAYVNAFDVCWVPFAQDQISAAANPVKIYEYLALGKPVVSTPVADTDAFLGNVAVGASAEEVIAALHAALADPAPPDAVARRVQFAEANTWAARARETVDFARTLGTD